MTPRLAFVTGRFTSDFAALTARVDNVIALGDAYAFLLAGSNAAEPAITVAPKDGLVIIYTSGTTGLPKDALISHRSEIARTQSSCVDFGLQAGGGFLAWPPMFHMASMGQAISVLSLGSKVIVSDVFDAERMVDITI